VFLDGFFYNGEPTHNRLFQPVAPPLLVAIVAREAAQFPELGENVGSGLRQVLQIFRVVGAEIPLAQTSGLGQIRFNFMGIELHTKGMPDPRFALVQLVDRKSRGYTA